MSFRIAHISDVHLGPLPTVRARDLAGKRLTGYLNWKRSRGKDMGGQTLAHLLNAMKAQRADHTAITGDLINIGLDDEVTTAGQWLRDNFDHKNTSVVPGNHDAYVPGTLAKALSNWALFMDNDDGSSTARNRDFPFLRVRGNCAIIGVSSAVATPAFVAAGRFGTRQSKRLADILEATAQRGLFRIIMIHHPPIRGATLPRKRLYGIGLFQKIVAERGAELVLHGHTHLPQRHEIAGPNGTLTPVIGVPSASQSLGGHRPAAAFNLFEISGKQGRWNCAMEEHSITSPTGQTAITETRSLFVE